MVGFGNKLLTEEVPEWHQYYIDYEGLKQKIDDLTAVSNDPNVPNVVATAKEHMFQGQLDSEIEKASPAAALAPHKHISRCMRI